MQQNNADLQYDNEISVFELLYRYKAGLKRFWTLILAIIGIFSCIGFGLSFITYRPYYSAKATFTITANVAVAQSYYNSNTANQLGKTFPNVLTSNLLTDIIKEELGVEELEEDIEVSFIESTNMFTLEVRSPTSQGAYNVLSSIITNSPRVMRYVIGNLRLNSISDPEVTTEPANSIEFRKYALIGAAVGFIIGFIILSVYAFTYTFIRRSDDIESELSIPLLGEIISEKNPKNTKIRPESISQNNASMKFQEEVYYIRNAVLRALEEKGFNTVIVTSTNEGEGSSTIALNLALALRSKNLSVLLVDGDLRKPSIAGLSGIGKPLSTLNAVLENQIDWRQAVTSLSGNGLDIICSEKTKQAADLISSDNMRTLIDDFRDEYDIVIIDTPPCGLVSDARSLAISADALLYVVGSEISKSEDIQAGIDSFETSNIEILGCVLNMSKNTRAPVYENTEKTKGKQKKPKK